MKNPKELIKLKASNEAFETMTNKELKRHFQKSLRANYSPKSVSTVSLLAMLLLSTLNSIFVTAVYRKIVFSKRALK